jgi:hypothetical protein
LTIFNSVLTVLNFFPYNLFHKCLGLEVACHFYSCPIIRISLINIRMWQRLRNAEKCKKNSNFFFCVTL